MPMEALCHVVNDNVITVNVSSCSNAHHHMHHGDHHDSVGNTYKKAVFVEYEDETFR